MIDWDRVTELRDEIGVDDFADVADIFLQEVDETIGGLEVSADPATLAAQLHFLKGSALNLGFSGFSTLCQEGESRAAAGAAQGVDLTALCASYRASRARFLAWLESERAG